jgi:hypothetical protein
LKRLRFVAPRFAKLSFGGFPGQSHSPAVCASAHLSGPSNALFAIGQLCGVVASQLA